VRWVKKASIPFASHEKKHNQTQHPRVIPNEREGSSPLETKKNLVKIINPYFPAFMKQYYTYILANKRNGTIYVGFTGDLRRRTAEHKEGKIPGFTKKYGIKMLVWYQVFPTADDAIYAEKKIKKWRRDKKVALIEAMNMNWVDLADPNFSREDLFPF